MKDQLTITESNPMRTFQTITRTILTALLVSAILAGCSAEARKARHLERAEKYYQAGEFEKAKIEYLNVLRKDPQDAVAFKRMGSIWLEQGAPLRAGPFLVRARELAPEDVPNRLNLTHLYLSLGAVAEGRKEAEAILEQAPGNGDAARLLVDASRTPEEISAAEEQLRKIPAKDNASFQLAVASLAFGKGDIPSAEKSVAEALRFDPKSRSAHTALAAIRLFQKDMAKAGEEFKAAADFSPLRSLERIQYAEFRAQTGGASEAITSLKAMTDQAPDYLPAWRLLGQIALAQKRYDEALAYLENVFKHDPENVDGRMIQAQVLVSKGEGAKAIEVLQRVDKAYPKVPPIKILLARANLLNKNVAEATTALNDALAVDPNNVEAGVLLAEINLRTGEPQAVVNALTEMLQKHPGLVPAQLLLADAYRLQGRRDEAASLFREQIKASPQSLPAYLGLGVILREQKKAAEARSAFEKALELSPANALAVDQLVELDIADKAFEPAMNRVRAQLEATSGSASAHALEGKVYAAQGQWDRAEAAFSKAIELDANFSAAYDLLIGTYIAANKLPQAATQIEAILAKNPENPAALMQLALIYDKTGELSKTAETYEKLVAIKPDFAPALNNLSYLYAEKLNQLDKAADAGRKARSLLPGDPSVADTLGWILYRQGDYQQAFNLLQESAGKLSDNPEVQFHLGSASYMMGKTDVARVALRKAAEATADFPGKDEARRRLALLDDSSGAPAEVPIPELESLVKQQPSDLVALVRLGEAYEKEAEFAKAAVAFEQAVKINPKLVSPTVKLAQLYAGPLRNPEKALELAKKARELAPNDGKVAGMIGALAFQSGNLTWSYSLLQEAARQLSDDAAVQHSYSWAAYSLGKLKEARVAMNRSLEISPDGPDSEDAKVFLALTDDESATGTALHDAAMKRLEADRNYVPALIVQASGLIESGDSKQAETIYLRVLERFPDFAPAQKALAGLYAEDPSRTAQAYDLAMKARKALPDDAELSRTLGQLGYMRKEYPRAIQLLHESERKKPLDAKGLFYLGMSHFQAKQKSPALDVLNRAIAAGLQEPLAAEANQALTDLQKD